MPVGAHAGLDFRLIAFALRTFSSRLRAREKPSVTYPDRHLFERIAPRKRDLYVGYRVSFSFADHHLGYWDFLLTGDGRSRGLPTRLFRSLHVSEFLNNLESVDTYEGTYDIHTLIIGHALTGVEAYS